MRDPDAASTPDIGSWYADLVERHGEEEGRARARAMVEQAGCVTKPHLVGELRARGIDLAEPSDDHAENQR